MVIGEFNDCYPPEIDGVGRVVNSYCEELALMGDDAYYIAPRAEEKGEKPIYNTLLYNGIKMPDEPYHVGIPLLDPKYMQQKKQIPFDIVHCHSPFLAGAEALATAKTRNIPIIATFHSKYWDDFYEKTHSELLATVGTGIVVNFYNFCDEVWAVNDKTAAVLREYGYKKEIVVMPNGTNKYTVREEHVRQVDEEYHLRKVPTFLFVGQMNWKKNIRRTLDAFALYSQTHDCQLIMVGQGPDEKEIREHTAELGIESRVVFTGHIVDRDRMMSIFARADVFIFPSLYDNAPMVVREAAVVGTPSILLKGSCAAEGIRDGYNGLLCEDVDWSVAECMQKGLEMKEILGANAQKTIPIQWHDILVQVRERYANLIEMKKRAR